MPTGPKGEKRPADVVGCAITVAKIAGGEMVELLPEKNGRVHSAKASGEARGKKLSAERRREIARLAAATKRDKESN